MARQRMLGSQSLRRKLKRLPDSIKGEVQEAITDSREAIYADSLAGVPVDQGDLAGALHRKSSSDKLGARIGYWRKGNARRWKRGGWRALFILFGTKTIPANNFLMRAYRKNERWVINRVSKAVGSALKKASNL